MKEKNVLLNLNVKNKEELFSYGTDVLIENGYVKDKQLFIEDLYKRESVSTTYIGQGVAIPHTRSDAVNKTTILFARTTKELEWSEEQDKADIFIFIVVENKKYDTTEQIEILSKIAKRLVVEGVTESLREAKTEKEVVKILDI